MYYTTNQVQNASADFEYCLVIPSMLTDFVNTGTSVEATKGGKESYCFHGDLNFDSDEYRCPASLPISSGRMEGINNKIKNMTVHALFTEKVQPSPAALILFAIHHWNYATNLMTLAKDLAPLL